MVTNLDELVELAKKKRKKTMSVAVAQDEHVLKAVSSAVNMGLIDAVLVGDSKQINSIAVNDHIDISNMKIIDEKNKLKAAARAVGIVSQGQADFIMKGMLGTAELLRAVLNKDGGLKGKGLLSHVMIYDVSTYHKLIFLTDGGMVTYPTLEDKIGIINNAVIVCKSLEIDNPKVVPICAVEDVNPAMQATVDAAVLSKMNKRGQIQGCIIDGPLALDNAVSLESARHKGIVSEVAGDADVLLVPNIESGNFLGKSLTYFAKAENAGVIVGAKCPVVLVSRTDSAKSKLYSIALGSVMCD